VHHDTNLAFVFRRESLEGQDIHAAIGQRSADLTESSRPIFQSNWKFFGRGHAGSPPVIAFGNGGRGVPGKSKPCGLDLIEPGSYLRFSVDSRFRPAPP